MAMAVVAVQVAEDLVGGQGRPPITKGHEKIFFAFREVFARWWGYEEGDKTLADQSPNKVAPVRHPVTPTRLQLLR